MANAVPLAQEMLELLQTQYAVAAPQLRPLESTGGAIKSLYRVDTMGRAYALKRYRPDFRDQRDLTAIHAAMAFLKEHGMPLPIVIPNRAGQLVTAQGDSCWVLYEWAAGHHVKRGALTAAAAAALGDLVGRMVLLLASWQTSWAGADRFEAYPAAERIAFYEQLLRHAQAGTAEMDAVCREELRYRMGALERLTAHAPHVLSMERQWVHGDCHAGNVLYDGNRLVAIVDFDNMRRAPRGFDFMRGLVHCFPPDAPERDAYAGAYMRIVRPEPAELTQYASLWVYTALCDIWPIDQYYLRPSEYQGASITKSDDWWERHLDETTAWLLGVAATAG